MQKNRLGRVSAEVFSRLLGRRNDPSGRGLENLEARQMLSADLPEGGEWVSWGNGRVAAVADQYLVTFDNYLGNAQAEIRAREVATRLGVVAENVRSIGRGGWASFTTTGAVSRSAVEQLSREMDGLRWVEPDRLQEIERVPNDPRYGELWHLENTGQFVQGSGLGTIGADVSARDAWDITIGSRDVVVAVIDTGVDVSHPDLAANIWRNPGEVAGNGIDDDGNGYTDDINGFDFGTLSAAMTDQVGHGTAVASVIGAVGNDGFGITGINW
ncbi:MAG: S8 family serine peptidase, partial [bacterium]|nr:S8 family serine peptidase [bacterium]